VRAQAAEAMADTMAGTMHPERVGMGASADPVAVRHSQPVSTQAVVVTADSAAGYAERLGAFVRAQTDVHFFQTPAWYEGNAGEQEMFFVLTLAGDEVVASSLVRRRSLSPTRWAVYRIERGPVAPNAALLGAHLEQVLAAVRHDAALVIVDPFHYGEAARESIATLRQNGWQPVPRVLASYEATVVVDLAQEPERLQSNLRRSLKTQLNRGQRLGIDVSGDSDGARFATFAAQFNAMARERGLAPIRPHLAEYLAQRSARGDTEVRLFCAHYMGEQIAGICLLGAGKRIVYEWGVSSGTAEHRQLPLTHMLHWAAIQWAQRAGYRYYDFGGYWEERGDADPINRFKTGFSKELQHFVPEHAFAMRPLPAALYRWLARARAGMRR
jgi:hypothetical protein